LRWRWNSRRTNAPIFLNARCESVAGLRAHLFGSGNPAVADSLHTLAELLRDASKHDEAETVIIAPCQSFRPLSDPSVFRLQK